MVYNFSDSKSADLCSWETSVEGLLGPRSSEMFGRDLRVYLSKVSDFLGWTRKGGERERKKKEKYPNTNMRCIFHSVTDRGKGKSRFAWLGWDFYVCSIPSAAAQIWKEKKGRLAEVKFEQASERVLSGFGLNGNEFEDYCSDKKSVRGTTRGKKNNSGM